MEERKLSNFQGLVEILTPPKVQVRLVPIHEIESSDFDFRWASIFFGIFTAFLSSFLSLIAASVNNLNSELVRKVRIPLPPLATQQAIVAEIEVEQVLVAANRELIARFEKKIQATPARVWGEDKPNGGFPQS
jgi:hypothetical protein